MAKVVIEKFIDDIDGTEAAETVEFGLDGTLYAIDLSSDNAAGLRKALSDYIASARRLGKTGQRVEDAVKVPNPKVGNKKRNQAIRAWARSKGYNLPEVGRIAAEYIERYDREMAEMQKAQDDVAPVETTPVEETAPVEKIEEAPEAANTTTAPEEAMVPGLDVTVKSAMEAAGKASGAPARRRRTSAATSATGVSKGKTASTTKAKAPKASATGTAKKASGTATKTTRTRTSTKAASKPAA